MRDRAREMFEYALSECSIPRAFSKHLLYDRGELSLGNNTYALGAFSRTLVVSIGKAGHTMAEALANTVGNRFT
jgi:glycerate-2-kinase